jgi:L-asparaginase
MRSVFGQCSGALIMLHGGAGPMDPTHEGIRRATNALRRVAAQGMAELQQGAAPLDVVVTLLKGMELDEQFNAGRGAALQADGQARLTAAVMESERGAFSGVMGARYLIHPSVLARTLQGRRGRVLAEPGTELLARELGVPLESAVTSKRMQRWAERIQKDHAFSDESCDTVGALVRTADGRLAVGTSTGGRGFEFPGRVSDSATVAGTYCSTVAAISATGTGEQIVDDALAARLETRRRDGMSLEQASRRCHEEALARQRGYGWIAVDRDGHWAASHTTPAMSWVVVGAEGELGSSAP